MLGEVLTAVVTPFRADGSVDLDAFRSLCGYLVENGSDGVVVTGTTGEAPTLSDDERLTLYEAALEALSGRGTVVAGHRDVLDRALDPPHGGRARARRRRVPRHHAVLQQAAPARHRGARRGHRRLDRPTGRLLRHPESRRRRGRARDDLAARRDRERPRRQAGKAEPRRCPPCGRLRARPLRRRRRPHPPVPRGRRSRRDLRAHARRRPAGEGADHGVQGRRRRRRARARRRSSARDRDPQGADEPDRDQAGAAAARARCRRAAPAARRGGRERDGAIRDCLERLGLLSPVAA